MTVKNKIMINATDLKPFYLYSSCLHYKFKLYKIVEAQLIKLIYFQMIFVGQCGKRIMRFCLIPENSCSYIILQGKITASISPA